MGASVQNEDSGFPLDPLMVKLLKTLERELAFLKQHCTLGLSFWAKLLILNGGEGGIRTHVPAFGRQDAFEAPPL